MSTAPEVAAGWYQDPNDASQWRWWNGTQWTADTAPMQAPQSPVQVAAVPGLAAAPVAAAVTSPTTTSTAAATSGDAWSQSRYIVCQKIMAIGSRYELRLPAPSDAGADKPADGELVGIVQRKRVTVKERIWFRDANERELFELVAPKVLNLRSRYELRLPDGTPFAVLKKNVAKSFWSTSWRVLDASGERELFIARESNALLAFLRRFGISWIGLIADLIPYQFTILAGADAPNAGTELGTYRRRHGVRDRYDLDLRGDAGMTVDRRAALGLAVALDVLQNR